MSALGDNGNYDVIPIAVIETEQLHTEQHHSLTEDDFNFGDEILECDDELNFCMELHCDARSIFGSLGGIAPEDYLNVYANYNVLTRQIDVYPQILLCEEFEASESIRSSKVQMDTRSEAQKLLYKLSDKRPAVRTEADVRGIINALIHDPSLIKEQETVPEITETLKLQQKLDDLLLVQPIDEVKAKQLIFQMASVQYAVIDNSEYETARLQRLISKCEPLTELDADLLAKVLDKVIVNKLPTQVILKNGQTISSEEVL